jgi:recombination protein RecT
VDLVARAGRATVWTGAVYPGDKFDYQLGDQPFCRHQPGDGGETFTHVYAIGRVKDAEMPVIEVWTRGKVNKHLSQYNKVGNKHYALASESNMEMYARKVALLQVLKYMPSSIELANALAVSNASEEGKSVVIDGDFVTVSTERDEPTGEIPPCSAESFDKKKDFWKGLVESGKKSPNDLINFIQTKEILSDDQKMEIASWAVKEGVAA